MPGTEGAEPSQDQVESIRRRVNEEARNVGLGGYPETGTRLMLFI